MKSFVEAGLKDVSISRKTIKWGIPWPGDPEHVFYVWYDALTSYMTGVGYGDGADGAAKPRFKKYWPADLHMIGKEIIRFHADVLARILDGRGFAAAQADSSRTAGCSSSKKK